MKIGPSGRNVAKRMDAQIWDLVRGNGTTVYIYAFTGTSPQHRCGQLPKYRATTTFKWPARDSRRPQSDNQPIIQVEKLDRIPQQEIFPNWIHRIE